MLGVTRDARVYLRAQSYHKIRDRVCIMAFYRTSRVRVAVRIRCKNGAKGLGEGEKLTVNPSMPFQAILIEHSLRIAKNDIRKSLNPVQE